MSRIIKFRAWLKDGSLKGLNKAHFESHGRLFDVDKIDFEEEAVYVKTPSELCFNLPDIELMQFTGLLDKNGVEIYEGDIVSVNECFSYRVEWKDKLAGWYPFSAPAEGGYEWDNVDLSYDKAEVIGNIHQNGDLLT